VKSNTEVTFLRAENSVSLVAKLRGRAMAQAVNRRPLTAEARVRSRVSPCGICGGRSGTGTGFSPNTSVLPCQFHSTGAPVLVKTKNKSSFSQGCTISLQGCGASVASAAGPFTKKTKLHSGRSGVYS
jgi:hypothetical protein